MVLISSANVRWDLQEPYIGRLPAGKTAFESSTNCAARNELRTFCCPAGIARLKFDLVAIDCGQGAGGCSIGLSRKAPWRGRGCRWIRGSGSWDVRRAMQVPGRCSAGAAFAEVER